MSTTSDYAVDLKEGDDGGVAFLGGKACNLARLIGFGIPVPAGFCVTTVAFDRYVQQNGLQDELIRLRSALGSHTPSSVTIERIRKRIASGEMPTDVVRAVAEAYRGLRVGDDPIVAVRSSATAEDAESASFAGQLASFLGVSGINEVINKVRDCWLAAFSERVLAYRRSKCLDGSLRGIAVVVQELVFADKAGVVFTVNPLTGNSEQLVVEATFGIGESLVSGRVTPDTWVIAKASGQVVRERIARKRVLVRASRESGRMEETSVVANQQTIPSLTRRELSKVVELALAVEDAFGLPQDIEWAIEGVDLLALQSRPITSL